MSSLDTAVSILGCFSPSTPELGITDVARQLNIPKSTVSRLMATMTKHRLVEQDQSTKRYRVGIMPFRLGQLYQAHVKVLDLLEAEVDELVKLTGFTGYLCVLSGADIVVLRVRQGRYPVRMILEPGYRVLAFATAAGKALLARQSDAELRALLPATLSYPRTELRKPVAKFLGELGAVRARLWAEAREETFPGMMAIAAAVGSADQQPVALSLSFPAAAVSKKVFGDIIARVIAAAERVASKTEDPIWGDQRDRLRSPRSTAQHAAG